MREQEVRELYEAYMQVHQPQEEVEQLDEEAPERITKPTKNKRLMKDAGPARVHNPNKVEEEVEKLDEAEVEKDPYTNPKTGKPHTYASRQAALKDKAKASPASTVKLADEFEPNIDEDAKYDRNRQRAAQRAAARNEARKQGKTGNVPGVGYVSPRPERETYRDSAGVERHTSGARMPKKEDQKESFDLFDTILEHLVAEGYADTNESALVIMANMSEEWRQSIVEEVLDEASKTDEFTRAAIARNSGRRGGITFEPGPRWDPSANRGKGANLSPNQMEKQRRKKLVRSASAEEN